MLNFLKRILGYSTQTEPVAPYKIEAPVAAVPQEPSKCGCGRSPSGYCTGLHKLSDAEWAAKQAADAPVAVVAVTKVKKVAGTKPAKAPKAKPAAITAKPAAPKAK